MKRFIFGLATLCIAIITVALCLFPSHIQSIPSLTSYYVDRIQPVDEQRRRLTWNGQSQYISWFTGESTETVDGVVPVVTCPKGKYRITSNSQLSRESGQRIDGCMFCPRGRYGDTEGITRSSCTADCPRGRYRDQVGGTSYHDCLYCPEGKVGLAQGLTSSECSGNCPSGYYSDVAGIDEYGDCKLCPTGYRGWQCTWERTPRRGFWNLDGIDGKINEESHAYVDGRKIPQGSSPVTFHHVYTPLENEA